MMKTTGLLVVFTLFFVLYQTSAVPVASSYSLENENVMEVMEAKDRSEEAGDEEKEEEEADQDDKKHEDKEEEEEEKKEDEESKEDEEKKDDEEAKDDEEKKEEKEEDEQEPDLNEEQNDQESSGEESVDLDSDHLVLQGSGSGKIKGVMIEDSEKEKDNPEKRSVDDQKKLSKATQEKRSGCGGCGDAFDSGGCDYMGGCGGAPGGVYGPGGGCGGCGGGPSCCGTNDWCAGGTMCSNCKGGFGPPITCGGCNTGCCPSLTFPCAFGATVNNPACECCKEKTPPGQCKWPCMWPCCCTCTPPKFEFKPLKPEPVCHCPSPHSHHTACGHHCLKRTANKGPVKRSLMEEQASGYRQLPHSYGFAPFYNPYFYGVPMMPFPRPF